MISQIAGILLEKTPPTIVIDVQGLGYEVHVPMTTLYNLPEIGQQVKLQTHFIVREDAQLLYGFNDILSRAIFRILIKVNGLGPKLGLAILSGMDAQQLYHCVLENDVPKLVRLPGVGKKTAERIIIETRDKIEKLFTETQQEIVLTSKADGQRAGFAGHYAKDEAISALIALGYKQNEASKAIKAVDSDLTDSADIIRAALQTMVG